MYQKSTADEKWEIVKQNNRCRKCLRAHHTYSCKKPDGTTCDKCTRRHHRSLHNERVPLANSDQDTETLSSSNESQEASNHKCLHILRTPRKELFSQKEIDHLFKTQVLPILTYGLAVYGASDSDLNVIQRFLDRCHKRHFTSQTVSIFNLLEQQDKSAF